MTLSLTLRFMPLMALPVVQGIVVLSQSEPTTSVAASAALHNGWTPRPTTAPDAHELGSIPLGELFARQDSTYATCGYVSGQSQNPLTCSPGFFCNFITSVNAANFGCCTSASGNSAGCQYVSTCIDYGAYNNPNTAAVPLVPGGDSDKNFYWQAATMPCMSNHEDTRLTFL